MARKKSTETVPDPDAVAGITPGKAKNAVKIAKVIVPAVLPVIAPYAARAAACTREGYDRLRARRIGIAVDQLGEYTGRGAGLHARINNDRSAVNELAEKPRDESDRTFVTRSAATLDQLATAVRAAERMPTTRRRAAHRAVGTELDRIEGELLSRLGIRAQP